MSKQRAGRTEANALEQQLAEDILQFEHDPLGFVRYAYPWGEDDLEGEDVRGWQRDVLEDIGRALQNKRTRHMPIRIAVASGHGPGKSALVAWLIHWAQSTMIDAKTVTTANTENQLRTKTWAEVHKWVAKSINKHWFNPTATSMLARDKAHANTWRADAIPWSEHNTEAFAGLHNRRKRILLVFDEASKIADTVWEVAEGALTDQDTEIIWVVFGNPTRNHGRFADCFGRFAHRWITRQIDIRTVPGANQAQIQQWLEDWGEDSDFFRVRVRGEFPRASDLQLIPSDWVHEARKREARSLLNDALIMGIDIARGGMDRNAIRFRRGMDARTIPAVHIPGSETRDTMKLVAKACLLIDEHQPDAVFVDATGVGGPVADRLRQLYPGMLIIDVQFGGSAPDPKFANMRAYMWWKLREGLKGGLAIDDDPQLDRELTAVEYGHDKHDHILLESKDDLKERLGFSPDDGDALALTYAMSVMPREDRHEAGRSKGGLISDYDPYAQP